MATNEDLINFSPTSHAVPVEQLITFSPQSGKLENDINTTPTLSRHGITINIISPNKSILSDSNMDDALYTESCDMKKYQAKSENQPKIQPRRIEQTITETELRNQNKLKIRSFSQNDNEEVACNLSPLRIYSKTDTLNTEISIRTKSTRSTISSIHSNCSLDRAFLLSTSSCNSVFSDVSDISTISKISSVVQSCNQAYLENFPSMESTSNNIIQTTPILKRNNLHSQRSLSVGCEPFPTPSDAEYTKESSKYSFGKTTDNSIIENNISNKNSSSYYELSDTVFKTNDEVENLILAEAKKVSSTLKEIADKSVLDSSTEDLLANNNSWMSELQPAFDEENIVDNLIELSFNSDDNVQSSSNNSSRKTEETSEPTGDMTDDKKSLLPFDPLCTEKKVAATMLLSDLEELVKTENNSEAIELLHNLQKVLGVGFKNNTDLLTATLNSVDESIEKIPSLENPVTENSDSKEPINQNSNEEQIDIKSNSTPTKSLENKLKFTPTKKSSLFKRQNRSTQEINNVESNEIEKTLGEIPEAELIAVLGKVLNNKSTEPATLNVLETLKTLLNISTNKNKKQSNIVIIENNKKIRRSKSLTHDKTQLKSTDQKHSPLRVRSPSKVIMKKSKSAGNESFYQSPTALPKLNKNKFFGNYQMKPMSILPKQTETHMTTLSSVKCKLQKKSEPEPVKKGPMKAVLPVNSMQRLGVDKEHNSRNGIHNPIIIFSSTPNSSVSECSLKSPKRKPVASSTPDTHDDKIQKVNLKTLKNTSSCSNLCETPLEAEKENQETPLHIKYSPQRSKTYTLINRTPKKQSNGGSSNIPKFSRSPRTPNSYRNHETIPERDISTLQTSPVTTKSSKTEFSKQKRINVLQSPLKDCNKVSPKIRSFNSIPKMQLRRTINSIVEKENTYI